jgi:hypothetical protein
LPSPKALRTGNANATTSAASPHCTARRQPAAETANQATMQAPKRLACRNSRKKFRSPSAWNAFAPNTANGTG